jgi:hypothetical protein
MKKILQISTIIGAAAVMLTYAPPASADTGGYVRIKGFDSHLHSLGFETCHRGTKSAVAGGSYGGTCKFASGQKDLGDASSNWADNELRWAKDDGEGIVAGADYGFFRLELEGTYQDGAAEQWRQNVATGGRVHQARLFANVVVEPFDLFELLGEFGGVESLVTYNPAHYGVSPYALFGYGVMGGLLEDLAYTRRCVTGKTNTQTSACKEAGAFGGGATAAVNVGAGVNIGLDRLARGFSEISGATLPEYFKLPIEFSIGYHWQVGLDELLFESMKEDVGIEDGGLTYSVGLKW